MPDEAGAAIINVRARVKHRFSHTGSITRNVSLDSARNKLLHGRQYGPVSQLSDKRGRNKSRFEVHVLHGPIGVLRTLFYQGESFRYTNAANWDGWG
jgi:hypothetical protein